LIQILVGGFLNINILKVLRSDISDLKKKADKQKEYDRIFQFYDRTLTIEISHMRFLFDRDREEKNIRFYGAYAEALGYTMTE
jgi:hypothetical protein